MTNKQEMKPVPLFTTPPAEKEESFKSRIDGYSTLASLAYKLAAAVGAIVTFAYLFSIQFFPTGLTPGEVVFFVFVALAFGFLYVVLLLYGAFSAIWLAQLFTQAVRQCRFRPKGATISKLRNSRLGNACHRLPACQSIAPRIYRFRYMATRGALRNRSLVPHAARGAMLMTMSFLVFTVMLLTALAAHSAPLNELLLSFFCGGFLLLAFSASQGSKKTIHKASNGDTKMRSAWFRWSMAFVLPLFLVFAAGKSMPLLHMVFQGLGIRATNVSIEVPESESSAFDRISDVIGRPILDCRKSSGGQLLVHNADVLWTSIGNETLVSFSILGPSNGDLFGPEPKILKQASLHLDTKAVRIIKTKPPLDPCFDLPSDLLFETAQYALTSAAQSKVQDVATAIQESGVPSRIVVRGHSDSRQLAGQAANAVGDNQRLSELRAAAVAKVLEESFKVPQLVVVPEGVGSREPKVKCQTEHMVTKYELERCLAPNRRVEIRVTFTHGTPPANRQDTKRNQ